MLKFNDILKIPATNHLQTLYNDATKVQIQ